MRYTRVWRSAGLVYAIIATLLSIAALSFAMYTLAAILFIPALLAWFTFVDVVRTSKTLERSHSRAAQRNAVSPRASSSRE